ncbi:MAG: hypothetical protein COB02_09675 [Candidatus Cloacimonadota bacterium]|nr:MAG: hypothetical protein COB02_09675 [Candidatus Cloacimonadota bacterium]
MISALFIFMIGLNYYNEGQLLYTLFIPPLAIGLIYLSGKVFPTVIYNNLLLDFLYSFEKITYFFRRQSRSDSKKEKEKHKRERILKKNIQQSKKYLKALIEEATESGVDSKRFIDDKVLNLL